MQSRSGRLSGHQQREKFVTRAPTVRSRATAEGNQPTPNDEPGERARSADGQQRQEAASPNKVRVISQT